MCRFVAYTGANEIPLETLILNADHSLVNQSKTAKESINKINADGFGVSWYTHGKAGMYITEKPIWSDHNLRYILRDIRTNVFLAHIRASTVGSVSSENCHPFKFKHFTFVHNGTIRGFSEIKRDLLARLDDDLFMNIKGQTDSECLFHLILQFYRESHNLVTAVKSAFSYIAEMELELSKDIYSTLNIAITDGNSLAATRYATKGNTCLSLFYSNTKKDIVVASEMLTDQPDNWIIVAENSIIFSNQQDNIFGVEKL